MSEIQNDVSEQTADFEAAARETYFGKRILVTGAAGSIGSQLIMKLIRFSPMRIIAVDKDENAIYELEQELLLRGAPVPVEPHVADIRDTWRLETICQAFAPQVIFHAAAYKQVSLMELHPGEAILGNVIGTKNLLDVVAGFGAERFVFVSSNEAANPVNVMGATKRIGELLVQSAAESGRVRAGSVRLGSVLGSRGSVVPLFRRQIASGGPVTVTHPDAQRCFITMRQGVQLILAAGCEARSGEIFVAENGTPRNIKELAQEMILLAGLEPGKDIEIRIVGLRPGEYLVKDIVTPTQRLSRTRFEGVSVIEPTGVDHRKLTQNMSQLVQAARSANPRGIDVILGMMGLSYKPVRPPPSVSVRPPLPSRSAEGQETLQSSPSAGPVGEGPAT